VRSRFVSSEHNPDIKRIKALRDRRSVRHAERLCIVEGPRFVEDAARVAPPLQVVVSESRGADDAPQDVDLLIVPDELFDLISDTATPQGILAVFRFPELRISPNAIPLLVIPDGIQDPGNLGTLLRSAAALGSTGVICGPGTVDPYSPKVIRAAAAAHWQIPIVLTTNVQQAIGDAQLLVTDSDAGVWIDQVDLVAPSAIVIGNEGSGISDLILSLPHTAVAIPMSQSIESLNAGISASIALYEANRQRRINPGR
jgi:RNA methyltransferase, TrmH family